MKIWIPILLLLPCLHGLAQTQAQTQTQTQIQPTKKAIPFEDRWMIETGINLSLRDTVVGFHLLSDGLNIRYLLCKDVALRLGFNAFHHTHQQTFGSDSVASQVGDEIAYIDMFTISPGIQKYFGHWGRIRPYVGVSFPFGHSGERDAYHDFDGTSFKSGFTASYVNNDVFYGINLLSGVDWTLIKGLYVGFEAGLQWNWERYRDIVFESNDNGVIFKRVSPGARHFQMNLFNDPFLRIGYRL